MDYELPTEFDIIILGTGIVESIISAAASRIGKKVLHIDNNNYYGGFWASFNLDAIQNLKTEKSNNTSDNIKVHNDECILPIGNNILTLENINQKWHIPEKAERSQEKEDLTANGIVKGECEEAEVSVPVSETILFQSQDDLKKNSRKFNIDLTPKLQFARGELVELLISSNIARYSEYRSVSRVLTWLNGQLESVPCSRSDVFANNKVSVIEKRILMKLLTSLDENSEELNDYENKTFRTFLKDRKLSPNLIHYVLYAISMSDDDTSCMQGIENTKRFLNSLGRFGKTPFLFSMYGSGEITQAFCRLSAVFGGIFALNQSVIGLILDDTKKFRSLICGKQRIAADHLVLGVEKAPSDFVKTVTRNYISRAVFITNKSILPSEKEHLTLLLCPPENGQNSCIIIEMGALTGTCPKDLYLVHMTSKQKVNPEEDLKIHVDNLFSITDEDNKPKILWSCYFSVPDTNEANLKNNMPSNVFLCPGPDLDLDYDAAVKKAKDIFFEIYPDLEFLPRAPDPEEIVIEGEYQEDVSQQENQDLNNTGLQKTDAEKSEETSNCLNETKEE